MALVGFPQTFAYYFSGSVTDDLIWWCSFLWFIRLLHTVADHFSGPVVWLSIPLGVVAHGCYFYYRTRSTVYLSGVVIVV